MIREFVRTPWIKPRQYVFQMNAFFAVAAGVVAAMYLDLGWSRSAAPSCSCSSSRSCRAARAPLSIAIGVACSTAAGFAGGVVIAAALTSTRELWWIAGALGVVPGALLMLDAHRKLRRASR
jgi:hypothetical protein